MQAINPSWRFKYLKAFEMGFQTALEYRVNFMISLISAAYPIFIQTFLWTAIYQASSSGVVYGYTYRQMIAYTFLAGLVTRIVRTGFEYEIMDDVKNGKFSRFLVQPLGYFPYRLCSYYGQKLPNLTIILAVMVAVLAGLSAFGSITLELSRVLLFLLTLALALMLNFLIFYCISAMAFWIVEVGFLFEGIRIVFVLLGLTVFWGVVLEFTRIVLFFLTMVLAVTLNFLIFYCISAMAFWIVEVGFLFEGIRIVIILLSGGIFPLEVLGTRFVQVTNLLPFKYTVNYPINVLTSKIASGEVALGILMQCFWIGACLVAANYLWRIGSRRYVAIGG